MASFGPTLVVGNMVQVIFWTQEGDQAGLNVRHWRVDQLDAGSNLLSKISDALVTADVPTKYKALISASASYAGMLIRVIYPTLSLQYAEPAGAGVGSVAGEPLPRQAAGFIRLRSEEPGKRRSGRVYVPFPSEADNVTGIGPSADYITRADSLGAQFVSTLVWGTLGQAVPVIYQRALPGASPRVRDEQALSAWATQRRRSTFGRTNLNPFG